MARALRAAFMAVTAAGGLALAAQPARAATLCVGSGPGCYPSIQAAVNAAHDGDTITIGPGTFAGGVTITGGVTRSSPESVPFTGVDGVWAAGGGVEIPPDASMLSGATVTISNSMITGNHVDPSATVPSGIPCPGFSDGQCPFASAVGGGIDSWGQLTLVNTTVSRNTLGAAAGLPPLSSDNDGAGITSDQGSLTLDRKSVV